MKYTIKHTCGCESTQALFGPNKSRESKIAYLESTLCLDCYKAEQAKIADEVSSNANLVALTGSEKQVAWANTIRANALSSLADQFTATGMDAEKANAIASDIINIVSDAKWYIDNRDNNNSVSRDSFLRNKAFAPQLDVIVAKYAA